LQKIGTEDLSLISYCKTNKVQFFLPHSVDRKMLILPNPPLFDAPAGVTT